eukprot:scaffold298050_cov35-Tisochrysis_lutea.AAC.1
MGTRMGHGTAANRGGNDTDTRMAHNACVCLAWHNEQLLPRGALHLATHLTHVTAALQMEGKRHTDGAKRSALSMAQRTHVSAWGHAPYTCHLQRMAPHCKKQGNIGL